MHDPHMETKLIFLMLLLVAICVFFPWLSNNRQRSLIERRIERVMIMGNVDGNKAGAAIILKEFGY